MALEFVQREMAFRVLRLYVPLLLVRCVGGLVNLERAFIGRVSFVMN